jgi:hypothetical protein
MFDDVGENHERHHDGKDAVLGWLNASQEILIDPHQYRDLKQARSNRTGGVRHVKANSLHGVALNHRRHRANGPFNLARITLLLMHYHNTLIVICILLLKYYLIKES